MLYIVVFLIMLYLYAKLNQLKKQRELHEKYLRQLFEAGRISQREHDSIMHYISLSAYHEILPKHPAKEPLDLTADNPLKQNAVTAQESAVDFAPLDNPSIVETAPLSQPHIPPRVLMPEPPKPPAPQAVTATASDDRPKPKKRDYKESLQKWLPKLPPINATTVILSIGVLFVILAGLIFATTSWQYFSNLVRTIIICSLVPLFFAVSTIAERKLKLPQTGVAFYTLGSAFLPITVLSIGYFRFLGDWFSIFGGGKYILGMAASLMMGVATTRGALKYRSTLYLWTTLTCLTLAVFCLIKYTTTTNDYLILFFTVYCWLTAWLITRALQRPQAAGKKYLPLLEQCKNFSITNFGMLSIAAAAAIGELLPAFLAAAVFVATFIKDIVKTRKFYYAVYPLAVFATLVFSKAFGAVLLFRTGWTHVLFLGVLLLAASLTWARLRLPDRLFKYLHPTILLALFSGVTALYCPAWLAPATLFAFLALTAFLLYYYNIGKLSLRTRYSDVLFAAVCCSQSYSILWLPIINGPAWGQILSSGMTLVIFGFLHISSSGTQKERRCHFGLCFAALLSLFLSQYGMVWDWKMLCFTLLLSIWLAWLTKKKRDIVLLILQPLCLLYAFYRISEWTPTWLPVGAVISLLTLLAFVFYLKWEKPQLRTKYSDVLFTLTCLFYSGADLFFTISRFTTYTPETLWLLSISPLVAFVIFALLHLADDTGKRVQLWRSALCLSALGLYFLAQWLAPWDWRTCDLTLCVFIGLLWLIGKRRDTLLLTLPPIFLLYIFNRIPEWLPGWLPSGPVVSLLTAIAFVVLLKWDKLRLRTKYSDALFVGMCLLYAYYDVLHAIFSVAWSATPELQWLLPASSLTALLLLGLLHLDTDADRQQRITLATLCLVAMFAYFLAQIVAPWDWRAFGGALCVLTWLTWLIAKKRATLLLVLQPMFLLLLINRITIWLPPSLPDGAIVSLLSLLAFIVYLKWNHPALRTRYSDYLFAGMCLYYAYEGALFNAFVWSHYTTVPHWSQLLAATSVLTIFGILHLMATESQKERACRLALAFAAAVAFFLAQRNVLWDGGMLCLGVAVLVWLTWLLLKRKEPWLLVLHPLVLLYFLYRLTEWLPANIPPETALTVFAAIVFYLYRRIHLKNHAVHSLHTVYSDLFSMACCLWGVYAYNYNGVAPDAIAAWSKVLSSLLALIPFAILFLQNRDAVKAAINETTDTSFWIDPVTFFDRPHPRLLPKGDILICYQLYLLAVLVGFFLAENHLPWDHWKILSGAVMLLALSALNLRRRDILLLFLHPLVALFCAYGISFLCHSELISDMNLFALCIGLIFAFYAFFRTKKQDTAVFQTTYSDILLTGACFMTSLTASPLASSPALFCLLPEIACFCLILYLSAQSEQPTRKVRITAHLLPYAFFWLALHTANLAGDRALFDNLGQVSSFGHMSDTLLLFFIVFAATAIISLVLQQRYPRLRRYEGPCGIAFLTCGGLCLALQLLIEPATLFAHRLYPLYIWLFTVYVSVQFYLWCIGRETLWNRRLKVVLLDLLTLSAMTASYFTVYSAAPDLSWGYLLCAPALSATLLWALYAYLRYGKKLAESPVLKRLYLISLMSLHWYAMLSLALFWLDDSLPAAYGLVCGALLALSYTALYLHYDTFYSVLATALFYPLGYVAAGKLSLVGSTAAPYLYMATAVFFLMAVLGKILFRKLNQRTFGYKDDIEDVDWFTLLNFIGPVMILQLTNDPYWIFFSCLLWAVYALTYYKRLTAKADAAVLTGALAALCAAYWLQPFFTIPEIINTELTLLPIPLCSFLLHKKIWLEHPVITSRLLYGSALYSALRLGFDIVYYEYIADALMMGTGAVGLLLLAFWRKERRWFLLATVTLLFLGIYMSKDYWSRLAWWVYLLTTGTLLISVATAHEWCRKHNTTLTKRLTRFMEDWEW